MSGFSDGTSVAIGKFDGIHAGHKRIINRIAGDKNPVIITFERRGWPSILTAAESRKMFESLGIRNIIEYPVNAGSFAVTPEDFVKNILVGELNVKKIVCGGDFGFGRKRSGNVRTLADLGQKYGFETYVEPDVIIDGKKVSSSAIRDYIKSGDMENVKKMLGYPYFIESEVIYGNRFGRTIGIPTINMKPVSDKILPPNGVYRTGLIIDEKKYKGITNIGIKPTVSSDSEILCETHIIDYCGDLYGREIKVDFYAYVRGEKKFASVEELKMAIMKDISDYKKAGM